MNNYPFENNLAEVQKYLRQVVPESKTNIPIKNNEAKFI